MHTQHMEKKVNVNSDAMQKHAKLNADRLYLHAFFKVVKAFRNNAMSFNKNF